ncbi:SEC-C metal-binding domain-containing protein [Rhizobium ruizarguesonis]
MSTIEVGDQLSVPVHPRQVQRITALHEGFLYQHLYAAACILSVGCEDGASIVIERDEDIEFVGDGTRVYIQVKTRNRPLQPADIEGSIEQFQTIRELHNQGTRSGSARLMIVTNTGIGPTLTTASTSPDWPKDILIAAPGVEVGNFPPAFAGIDEAFGWCVERARNIPFGTLPPETLVWKLAARVQHAAAGAQNRTFSALEMKDLFEQLLIQLQYLPDPPSNYRPQIDEPLLVTRARVRMVVGFSGAGKTAWASQAVLHSPVPVAYIDVAEMPAAAVAVNVARELAARFLGGNMAALGGASLAEQSGLNVLRLCARRLADDGTSVQVIIDNAHKLEAAALRSLIDAAPELRFLCLAQPWDGASEIEATYSIEAERLGGWSTDEIAAEFKDGGTPTSIENAIRVRGLTGGLPLYVQNAAAIAAHEFAADVLAFCDAIEKRTNDRETAQEIILQAMFESMDDVTRKVSAYLSFLEIPITRDELFAMLGESGLKDQSIASSLRKLRRSSLLIGFQGNRIALHDAVRPLATDARSQLEEGEVTVALTKLALLLIETLPRKRDVPRLGFLMRLLPKVGMTEVLVEMAGYEMFHEQGDPRSLRQELEIAADDPAASASDRFWANDALAYWDSRDGGNVDYRQIALMKSLVEEGQLGLREQLNVAFKEMMHWGTVKDRSRLDAVFKSATKLPVDAEARRLLRFNYAVSLDRARAFADARQIADALIAEYYEVIGMKEADVFGKSNAALRACLDEEVDQEDLKRLADSLALWSHIVVAQDEPPYFRRIAAMKFYYLAQAARSVVQTGLEIVDDQLVFMADPAAARMTMEQHVLPMLRESQLTDMILPVRSMYAIVLAWNSEHSEARQELSVLARYDYDNAGTAMLEERRRFVDNIIAKRVWLQRRVPPPPIPPPALGLLPRRKIGRNEPCSCGSGLKYKKCCGGLQADV